MRTALIARYWPSHPDGVTGFEALDWLAPYIEAVLARKPRMPPVADAEIPRVEAFGRKAPSPLVSK